MRYKYGFITALSFFFVQGTAFAQADQCNAVLRNGTFKFSSYKDNNYYMQIVYSNFISSTFDNSKSDTSLGLGVPVGEAVMGSLNYGKEEYDAKKAQINKVDFQRVDQSRELQTMLYSGDGAVLTAWSDCIRNRGGGLIARFEPRTATLATLVIEYLPQGANYRTRIAGDIRPFDIDLKKDVSNPSCLKGGTWIVQSVGCRTDIRLKDGWTPLSISINTQNGAATAYLPQRIKLSEEHLALDIPSIYEEFFRQGDTDSKQNKFVLSPEEKSGGWVIDPASVRVSVRVNFDNGRSGTNHCHDPRFNATNSQITYVFSSHTAKSGGDGYTIGCTMSIAGEKMRIRWLADEAVRLPSPPLNYIPAGAPQ